MAFILFSLLTCKLFAVELPEFNAKQDIVNLRYFTTDGRFTYYQRQSGELLVASNYKVVPLLKKEDGDQYAVSAQGNKVLIAHLGNIFQEINTLKGRDYYIGLLGEEKPPIFVGRGVSGQLHLDGSWFSLFRSENNELLFFQTNATKEEFKIKLARKEGPYFLPLVHMIDANTILYTDINKAGKIGLFRFLRSTKKIENLHTTESARERLAICSNEESLFVMEWGIDSFKRGTMITRMPLNNIDFGKRDILYDSPLNDLGSLLCEGQELYFVKRVSEKRSEAAKLDINTKSVEVLSNLEFVGHLIKIDNTILLPHRGQYFIVKGSDITQTDKIK